MFGATYFAPIYFGHSYFGPELTIGAVSNVGDDFGWKRPVLYVKEKQAIKALEALADIRVVGRTADKRRAVKAVKQAVSNIAVPQSMASMVDRVISALAKASRCAGEYSQFQIAAHYAVDLMRDLIAEMRRKRRREEEQVILWFLH